MDTVRVPRSGEALHCAFPSLGPSPGGVGSTLFSLAALLVVSVCLKEVCPTLKGKTDFLEPGQPRADEWGTRGLWPEMG